MLSPAKLMANIPDWSGAQEKYLGLQKRTTEPDPQCQPPVTARGRQLGDKGWYLTDGSSSGAVAGGHRRFQMSQP